MRCKVKDFLKGLVFIAAFLFIGSGMLECCILRLLEALGL